MRFEVDGYLNEDDLPGATSTADRGPDVSKAAEETTVTKEDIDALVKLVSEAEVTDEQIAENVELFKYVKPSQRGGKKARAKTTDSHNPASSSSSPSQQSVPESPRSPRPLTIRSNGDPSSLIPQSQIFDLKTRTIKVRKTNTTLEDELPRLWVTQVSNFIMGYHRSGFFLPEDIEIKDVRPDVQKWEEKRTEDKTLAKLAAVVRKLVEIVGELEEQGFDGGREDADEEGVDGAKVDAGDGDERDGLDAQGVPEASKGQTQASDHGADEPTAKTPTSVRIEVLHRSDNVGTLEVRRQGWKKSAPTSGDSRNGVLSSALREKWLAAQGQFDTALNNLNTKEKEAGPNKTDFPTSLVNTGIQDQG